MTLTEWIFSKLPTIDKDDPYYRDIIEQANQMEMQRIMQSYNDGKLAVINIDKNKSLEGYYNKTYASKENELQQINQDNPMTRGSTALVKVTSSQTEISDEEIKKQANIHGYEEHSFFTAATSNQKKLSWIAACKWYREQLKKK